MSDRKIEIKQWKKQQDKLGKKFIFPAVILGMLSSVIAVGLAWCIAQILGKLLVPSIDIWAQPKILLLSFVILSLLKGLLLYCEEILAKKAGIKARGHLRKEIMGRIIQIGPSVLQRQSGGALATLIVDQVEALDGYFSRWLPASILWFMAPVLILVFIFFIQPWSALIIGLCGLMVPIAQAVFGIGAAVAARKQFLAMTRLQSRFLDRIKGIATIVLAGQAENEAQKLSVSADDLRKRTMKILRVAFLSSASIDCAMIVAIILVAMVDVGQLFHGHSLGNNLSVIHVLFTLLIIPDFFAPLRSLALAYQDRARLSGTAESVVELPNFIPETENQIVIDKPKHIRVVFEHVSYSWDPKRGKVLDNISFDIQQNDIGILIGESGAGKSTIIEMLLGFIQPQTGCILLNDIDLKQISHQYLSSMIAWIGQKPVIFSGSIKENILFAKPNATDEELQHAVKAAAIDQYLSNLPQGLNTVIGEGGYGLSGGQAQRIAIARAYLKDAPLLLLDEPTAHLDPETEKEIFNQLIALSFNRTVILATHSSAGQSLKGMHLYLDHGRLTTEARK